MRMPSLLRLLSDRKEEKHPLSAKRGRTHERLEYSYALDIGRISASAPYEVRLNTLDHCSCRFTNVERLYSEDKVKVISGVGGAASAQVMQEPQGEDAPTRL
jgi:hypothetical protein